MLPARVGKYSVIRKIASGGMADIYLCRFRGEEGFEKKVAVKVIHPRLSESARFRDLFAREARIAAKLAHPNLIQVFDFGRESQSLFLAMEYVDGWNLAQAVSRSRVRNLPVPLPVWRYWMEGILAAIGYLHAKGIIHRDISPSNILLSRGGTVKITDFGIARAASRGTESGSGWEGKYSYMSPEQARGGEADEYSDLFAAAVIGTEIFLPGRLFDGASPEAILSRLREYEFRALDLSHLPSGVAGALGKGLSTEKEGRYRSTDEFAHAVCGAVPSAAGRGELQNYWDALFSDEQSDDDTVVMDSMPDRQIGMVRETRNAYGNRNARLLGAGILSALAAASVGGWIVWKELDRSRDSAARHLQTKETETDGSQADRFSAHTSNEPVSVPIEASRRKPVAATPEGKYAKGSFASPERTSSSSPEMHAATRVSEIQPRDVVLETDPPGASIALEDGTPLGKTPVRLNLAPLKGRKIVFQREGYDGKSVQADVLVEFKTFRLELERQVGTIEVVQAIPWARVFDGDRYVGDTPIHKLILPVGSHRLRFVNEPLGIEQVQEVMIRRGSNPKLIVPLVGKSKAD